MESTLRSRLVRRALLASLCASTMQTAAASPPIEAYGRLPATELATISPSGDKLALISVAGEARRLSVVTVAGKTVKAFDVGNSKVRSLQWAGDDHLLVHKTTTTNYQLEVGQSYELSSVVQVSMNDDKLWRVFQDLNGIEPTVRGSYGAAMQGGRWYGYFGGITLTRGRGTEYFRDHGYADLYQVDLDSGKPALVAHGGERDHDWSVSAEGDVLAHSDYEEKSGEWRLFAGVRNDSPLLKKNSPLGDVELLGAGHARGTVLVLDNSGDESLIEEINLADGKAERLLRGYHVIDPLFDRQTRLLMGASIREEPLTVLFDEKLQSRADSVRHAFPKLQVHLISYDAQFQRTIVKTDGGDDSGTYWLIDIASGKAMALGSAYPDIMRADVGSTQAVKYQAADGLALDGILTLPPAREAKKLPFVMFPHGGPIGVADEIGFDWWAQALASRGYAVFQPNYRGSGHRTVALKQAGYGEWGRKMLSDMADGMAELAKQGIIDPSRACIMGGSYGGYAALAGVTIQKGSYRCAVSVAGPANMVTFRNWETERNGDFSSMSRSLDHLTGVDPDGGRTLREISPALHADSASAPILLVHGKDDTRVPIEQSEEMASALKHAGKPYDYVILPHEDHFLSREATRTAMLKAAVSFIEKNNPP
jgi:dipeptidyl aminopeptidase/acylaminoacyl peptidase